MNCGKRSTQRLVHNICSACYKRLRRSNTLQQRLAELWAAQLDAEWPFYFARRRWQRIQAEIAANELSRYWLTLRAA